MLTLLGTILSYYAIFLRDGILEILRLFIHTRLDSQEGASSRKLRFCGTYDAVDGCVRLCLSFPVQTTKYLGSENGVY
jgi:hypothetical protein